MYTFPNSFLCSAKESWTHQCSGQRCRKTLWLPIVVDHQLVTNNDVEVVHGFSIGFLVLVPFNTSKRIVLHTFSLATTFWAECRTTATSHVVVEVLTATSMWHTEESNFRCQRSLQDPQVTLGCVLRAPLFNWRSCQVATVPCPPPAFAHCSKLPPARAWRSKAFVELIFEKYET